MSEKISIENQYGEKLVGLKQVPEGRYPAVILVHGFHVTKSESGMFDKIETLLTENGFGVFRFDFSGCGESQGDYSETTLTKLISDLNTIIEHVKSQDITWLGILGQSLGGLVTILTQPKADAMVIMNTPSNPKQNLIKYFGDGYNPIGISVVQRSDGRITKVKPKFWDDMDEYNPLNSVRKLDCPILFIHAGRDTKVSAKEMRAYYKNAKNAKWKQIKGADHGFRPRREEMYKLVTKWFLKWK